MTEYKKFHRIREYWVLFVLIVFFGGMLAASGIQEFPDSETYIGMYLGREPVYPLFLLLLRTAFGDYYKWAAVILQNALAIYAVYCIIRYVRQVFKLNVFGTSCTLIVFLIPQLLTPLASASHMVYTNSILSEGISYSIYNIMAYYLLRLVLEERKRTKDGIGAILMALLLSLTRAQMMPMLLVWGCVVLYGVITSQKGKKRLVQCAIVAGLTIASFGARNMLMLSYNYIVKDVWAANLGSGTTLLTNIIYSADARDGEGIQDTGIRDTFYYIQEKVEEEGWNYKFAGNGFLEKAIHLEESHDRIKFNQIELFITWYLNDKQGLEGRIREVETDRVASEMAQAVILKSYPKWLSVYAALVVTGFIRTVAVIQPVLNWYAAILYLSAAVLMAWLLRRNLQSKAAKCMLLVFLLICANVFATSITIMCLSRYMIYNMPLFYMAGIIMLWELWSGKKKR